MKRSTWFVLLIFLWIAPETFGDSPIIEDTPKAACIVLKRAVATLYGLPESGPPELGWFCDVTSEKNDYVYIIALRSNRPPPYSNLMGWFAVMRRSDVVLGFDVAESRIVPLADHS